MQKRTSYKVSQNSLIRNREKNTKNLKSFRKKQPIAFPKIFDDSVENQDIFSEVIRPKIKDSFRGVSFSLLTYGISGSGKTHTIFGCEESRKRGSKKGNRGIIYHAIKEIFSLKKEVEMDKGKLMKKKQGPSSTVADISKDKVTKGKELG